MESTSTAAARRKEAVDPFLADESMNAEEQEAMNLDGTSFGSFIIPIDLDDDSSPVASTPTTSKGGKKEKLGDKGSRSNAYEHREKTARSLVRSSTGAAGRGKNHEGDKTDKAEQSPCILEEAAMDNRMMLLNRHKNEMR
ncbi:hypothetical protein Droror1_Dr00004122 [Drosera rotundifolia]